MGLGIAWQLVGSWIREGGGKGRRTTSRIMQLMHLAVCFTPSLGSGRTASCILGYSHVLNRLSMAHARNLNAQLTHTRVFQKCRQLLHPGP